MSEHTPDPAGTDPAATPPAEPVTPPAPIPADGGPQFDGDFDPDRAKSLIAKLREENKAAKAATLAAQQAARQAADAHAAADRQRTEQLDQIARFVGVLPDDGPPDPAKLTEQLTAAQAEQRQARIDLAVYRAAAKHGVDADRVLDSRTFIAATKGIDPGAADFADRIGEVLTTIAEQHTWLRSTPAESEKKPQEPKPKPGVSGGEITGGGGTKPITMAQLEDMYAAGKYSDIERLQREGRLAHLM